ncbi:MAG TPA: sigma-54 dependent transcriptional regulator [Thermodesulfobacteriota bacterium]
MKILIVDDEEQIHYAFRKILPEGTTVVSALSGEEALAKLADGPPDLVIMDVRMGGMTGLATLQTMRERYPRLPIVIMTAYGTMQTAIEAMKLGAFEYLLKPFDIPRMQRVIDEALATARAQRRGVAAGPPAAVPDASSADAIIGVSTAMQEVYKQIGRVAEKDITVLIRGESGTGKELVARAIYRNSRRALRPFVVVNCAAIPDTLLESELFGYERGAFTGAQARHAGRFEQADGGTIFLDEIGELKAQTQAKLLRVLQEGEVTPLGGGDTRRVDVRVLCATNRDLHAMLRAGQFREDLFYRLNVITIEVPPLRERREDIPVLVAYFLDRFQKELGRPVRGLDPAALRAVEAYPWPGNVRELENTLKRAVLLAKGPLLTAEDLRLGVDPGAQAPEPAPAETPPAAAAEPLESIGWEALLERALARAVATRGREKLMPAVERVLITKALERTAGNQVQAARLLGISRNTLRSRMSKYAIRVEPAVNPKGEA